MLARARCTSTKGGEEGVFEILAMEIGIEEFVYEVADGGIDWAAITIALVELHNRGDIEGIATAAIPFGIDAI